MKKKIKVADTNLMRAWTYLVSKNFLMAALRENSNNACNVKSLHLGQLNIYLASASAFNFLTSVYILTLVSSVYLISFSSILNLCLKCSILLLDSSLIRSMSSVYSSKSSRLVKGLLSYSSVEDEYWP